MVYRTIIHLNIELQIPVIYRADFGLRGFTPFPLISIHASLMCNPEIKHLAGFVTLYANLIRYCTKIEGHVNVICQINI